MNTDKLVPIDFSRKITPFVVGDVVRNIESRFDETIEIDDLPAFNETHESDSKYHVISYADRPNTGKQPVADDVVVDYILETGKGPTIKPRSPSNMLWDLGFKYSIETWKPNHDAMVERYQATLTKEWPTKEQQENINPGIKPELSAIETLKSFGYKHENGVWSQQEIKPDDDAKAYNEAAGNSAQTTLEGLGYEWLGGEQWKPPIGKMPSFISDAPELAAYMNPHVKDSSIERLGVFLRKNELVVEGEGVIDCVIRELAEKHDIDIRTDEEKLRDAMVDVIGRPDSLDSLGFLEDDLNKLMASPLLTITFKGK